MSGDARTEYARIICHQCSDVIGVYEPLVLETPGGRRETSLAADRSLYESDRPCYHRACYELTHDDA
jgi:hypothetical protein